MKDHLSYFLFAVTSLFTIINPLGAMPFYTSLVEGSDAGLARRIAFRACLAAFVAILFFAITGKFIFSFFHVSIDGLRIVGGILFFLTGYDLLQGKESRTKIVSAAEKMSLQDVKVKAITPLAVPLICGPGTITVMTVMIQEAHFFFQRLLLFSAALIVCIATYLILVSSQRIMSLVGESGQKVFFRLMGLILMMISVEFFFLGLRPYVQKLIDIH